MDQRSRRAPREYPLGETNDPNSTANSSIHNLKILSLNVEGLTNAKKDVIEHIAQTHAVHVIFLQETDKQHEGFCIPNYDAAFESLNTANRSAGLVTLVRKDIPYKRICNSLPSQWQWHCVEIHGIKLVNVYRPPSSSLWNPHDLPTAEIYIGDFNCAHTAWGYKTDSVDGTRLMEWTELADLHVHYQPSVYTFRSAIWGTSTHPDLVISRSRDDTDYQVLSQFPKSQHFPILTTLGTQSPQATCRDGTSGRLTGTSSGRSPRSPSAMWRSETSPKLGKSSANSCALLLKEASLEGHGRSTSPAGTVAKLLCTKRPRRLTTTPKDAGPARSYSQNSPRTANNAGLMLANVSRIPRTEPALKHQIRAHMKSFREEKKENISLSGKIQTQEVIDAIREIKQNKQPGLDQMFPEFLKNLGPNALSWLTEFLQRCFNLRCIPKIWRKAKIIPVLKPKKDPVDVRS